MRPDQEPLAAPGAGLPPVETWVARHVIFPWIAWRTSPSQAVERFVAEGRRILDIVSALDPGRQRQRVRTKRLAGLEDSSREWSPLMVVEHLLLTGPGMLGAARSLAAGVVPGRKVSTAAVKPKGLGGPEILEDFGRFLDDYAGVVKGLTFPVEPTYAHPWFGSLDARKWIVLNSYHQRLHRRQLELIVQWLLQP